MAVVLEARDPRLDRRVVLKTPHTAAIGDAKARDRLIREALVLSSLDHPSLLKIIDVVEADAAVFLVMPLHEGRTLGSWLATARVATGEAHDAGVVRLGNASDRGEALRRLLSFLVLTANALHCAHEAGVVHRDIKPENLLVLPNGSPMVLDFGLALPGDDPVRLTATGEVLGTPMYMAPEQIEGAPVTRATDVYSLGVVAFECLTLVHPFSGRGGRAGVFRRILAGDPVPPRKHSPQLARDLEAVVLRAIEREPARRYPTAAAFAADLRRVLDLEPTEARPVSALTMVWRRLSRRPRIAVLVLVAVLAMAAAAAATIRVVQLLGVHDELRGGMDRVLPGATPGPLTDELRRLRELLRSLPIDHIVPVYPRANVRAVECLTWIGYSPIDEIYDPGERLAHRYRVTLLDATDTEIWAAAYDQSNESQHCELVVPSNAATNAASWRVVWVGAHDAKGEWIGARADQSQESTIAAPFRLVPSPLVDEPPPGAVRLRALLDAGLAAEVLRRSLRAPDLDALDAIGALRFAAEAAGALGDVMLQAAIESEVRNRIQGR